MPVRMAHGVALCSGCVDWFSIVFSAEDDSTLSSTILHDSTLLGTPQTSGSSRVNLGDMVTATW